MRITEARKEEELYFKGPFWIVANSVEDIYKGKYKIMGAKYLCDFDGKIVSDTDWTRASTTHKRLWRDKYSELANSTDKPFDYYPRGRVDIWDGKAYIFIHSSMNFEPLIGNIISEYELDLLDDYDLVEVIENDSQGSHYNYMLEKYSK